MIITCDGETMHLEGPMSRSAAIDRAAALARVNGAPVGVWTTDLRHYVVSETPVDDNRAMADWLLAAVVDPE